MVQLLLSTIQIPDLSKRIQKQLFLYSFLLISLFAFQRGTAQVTATGDDSEKLQYYNSSALKLLNEFKYDESIEQLNLALKVKENQVSYYYLGHIYLLKNEWEEAIKNDEQATRLDTTLIAAYQDMFIAYGKVGRWKDAQKISDKLRRNAGTNIDFVNNQIALNDTAVENENRSYALVGLFLLLLAGVFFLPYYRSQKDTAFNYTADESKVRFSEMLLISASVCCVLYIFFYSISHWVWSQNTHVPLPEYAIFMRMATLEHDGIESYVMYIMMFINIVISLFATTLILKLKKNKPVYLGVFTILLIVAGYYFFSIGFFPPFPSVNAEYIMLPFELVGLSVGLFVLYKYNSRLSKAAAILLIAYTGLIPLYPPSLMDFEFILDPALRLYHGFKVSEIYFQYDIFMSALACGWMKLNLPLDWFPYLGTFAFFLFLIGGFFFGEKYFKTKGLSVIFIVALVVARIYLIDFDTLLQLQSTPLRLDLWIILLLVAHYKGINHWLLGICVGLLVLFHRNLGLIYFMAYVELLVVLFSVDVISLIQEKALTVKSFSALLVRHLRANLLNIVIVISSIALCFILFKELFSASAIAYRKIGINFLPVSRFSFYWYFPVILACLTILLFYYRKKLGERYTATGFFIVLLAIGESMYFFGRSHENAVLNLTGMLVLTLFALFDLLIFQAPEAVVQAANAVPASAPTAQGKTAQSKKPQVKSTPVKRVYFTERNVFLFLPFLFIFLVGYFYSGRIMDKAKLQYSNLIESNFAFPMQLDFMDTAAVRQVAHNSPHVFILDNRYDFYFYYYGKYVPQGYYNPFLAYIYKKDIIDHVQSLLDQDYYVIYNAKEYNEFNEYLPYLRYNQSYQKNNVVSLKKEKVPYLLNDSPSSLLHIAMKDSLASPGLDYGGLNLPGDMTIDLIIKPMVPQLPTACVFNNLTQYSNEGLKGMTFQQSGSVPNQYLVAFSNGNPAIPNVVFNMDNNVWNYITVTLNRDAIKVYDNGRLLGTAPFGGQFANSELPLTIGNRSTRDCRFRGYIKEIRISKGNTSEAEIISTGQRLGAELNGAATAVK